MIWLMVILLVPNPYPPEMLIEPVSVVAVAEAPVVGYTPTPFAPGDDHSDPTRLEGQLDEAVMRTLIESSFPEHLWDWAMRVSWCESRWDTRALHPRSGAAGLFQFKESTWDWVADQTGTPTYRQGGVWDAHDQMTNAVWLVLNGGKQHWVCK